jgi:hypothetical protein
MEPLGILLYGYSEDDSNMIKKSLDTLLSSDITIISGSNKESMKLIEILEKGPDDNVFINYKNKIIVFLGFNERQINIVLNDFSKVLDLKRPIFCGLTEQNINWPLSNLIEHLIEEDNYWSEKNKRDNV